MATENVSGQSVEIGDQRTVRDPGEEQGYDPGVFVRVLVVSMIALAAARAVGQMGWI